MPTESLYVRVPAAIKDRLDGFVESHPEYPSVATAAAGLIRLGLDYEVMQQRVNELSTQLAGAQRMAVNLNATMQLIAGQFGTGQRDEVDQATMSMLAHQMRVLSAILDAQPSAGGSPRGSERHPVNGPIRLVGGPLHGQQFQMDLAPEVFPALIGGGPRVAYYRLDLPTLTYNFIEER